MYRRLMRLSRTWEAVEPVNTKTERNYIADETQRLFRVNISAGETAAAEHVREAEARLAMATHYRNPYPRPVNLPPKSYSNKEGKKAGIRVYILAPVAHTRLTEDLPGFDNEKAAAAYDPKLVSPLMVYLASDLSKDMTGKTFLAGGGRIAEMKVVTAEGQTKEQDGGLWTAREIAEKMHAGEILLPE